MVSFVDNGHNVVDPGLVCAEHRLLFSSSQASLLLRKLEEISVKVSQGAGSEYLGILSRMVEGKDQKEALKRLQLVRLALARYFARCTVLDV